MSAKKKADGLITRVRRRPAAWEQRITCRAMVEVALDEPDFDGDDLGRDVILPFVPRIGDQIAPTPGCDFLEVEEIFWVPREGLTVWFKAIESRSQYEWLVRDGWRTA